MPVQRFPRWPASANAVRLRVIENAERMTTIIRDLLNHPADEAERAALFELLALAEESRRLLGEARPGEALVKSSEGS